MAYSQTHHKLTELGKLEHTLNGRLPGTHYYIAGDDPRLAAAGLPAIGGVYMIGDGVIDNGDGTYRPKRYPRNHRTLVLHLLPPCQCRGEYLRSPPS